jgi:thioesterase domain-containing protein
MTDQNTEVSAAAFHEFLHLHFPIAAAMQVTVDTFTEDEVVLRTPLTPNQNVHQTGFAGSLYSLGALAGWGLVHGWLAGTRPGATLLIGRGEIDYRRPVRREFTATASMKHDRSRTTFLDAVSRCERAELELGAVIRSESEEAAIFTGHFVVLNEQRTS